MSDDNSAQQRGRESRDLGAVGEDTIRLFASQLRLAATKSERDIEGWDLSSDIAEPTKDAWGLPASPPVICRFQIKTTETSARSTRIGRDNILRMIGQSIPWFVILVRCEERQAKKIDVIHIGQEIVEDALKWAITEPEGSGFQLPGRGSRVEVEPEAKAWLNAIENAMGDKATYAARKLDWYERAGRPDPAFRFSCAIQSVAPDELADLFLGLRTSVDVNQARISEERFGVPRVRRDIGDAKMEMPEIPPLARVQLTARSPNQLASVECDLYSTVAWLPASLSAQKARLRMKYFDLILQQSANQSHVSLDFPADIDLDRAAREVRFFEVLRTAEEVTIACGNSRGPFQAFSPAWSPRELGFFQAVMTTHEFLWTLGFPTSKFQLQQLLRGEQLALAQVVLGKPGVRLVRVPFKDRKLEDMPKAVVHFVAVTDGQHRAGFVVRFDGNSKVENGVVVFEIERVTRLAQFAFPFSTSNDRLSALLKEHADEIEAIEGICVDWSKVHSGDPAT